MKGTDVMGSSLSSGRVRCIAFCREDLLKWGDDDLEEDDDVANDGKAKSLTQARDNLLQLVVVAILFNSSAVYRMTPCYWCYLTKV